MVDSELIRQIHVLAEARWAARRIAREVGVARNTVRRYLRRAASGDAERPVRRGEEARAEARRLFDGPAGGKAVVVTRMLAEQGLEVGIRCVQARWKASDRGFARPPSRPRSREVPGAQMQIDFGQKRLRIGGAATVVHLLVSVLSTPGGPS